MFISEGNSSSEKSWPENPSVEADVGGVEVDRLDKAWDNKLKYLN